MLYHKYRNSNTDYNSINKPIARAVSCAARLIRDKHKWIFCNATTNADYPFFKLQWTNNYWLYGFTTKYFIISVVRRLYILTNVSREHKHNCNSKRPYTYTNLYLYCKYTSNNSRLNTGWTHNSFGRESHDRFSTSLPWANSKFTDIQ